MLNCKRCCSKKVIRNGIVRNSQRWQCKECRYNFIDGDRRTNSRVAVKKALSVLLYSTMKGTYNHIAKILDTSPSLVYRWISEASVKIGDIEVCGEIKELEFDEMWHYLHEKKENFGLSKHLTVAQVNVSHGKSAVVILPHFDDYTRN